MTIHCPSQCVLALLNRRVGRCHVCVRPFAFRPVLFLFILLLVSFLEVTSPLTIASGNTFAWLSLAFRAFRAFLCFLALAAGGFRASSCLLALLVASLSLIIAFRLEIKAACVRGVEVGQGRAA